MTICLFPAPLASAVFRSSSPTTPGLHIRGYNPNLNPRGRRLSHWYAVHWAICDRHSEVWGYKACFSAIPKIGAPTPKDQKNLYKAVFDSLNAQKDNLATSMCIDYCFMYRRKMFHYILRKHISELYRMFPAWKTRISI